MESNLKKLKEFGYNASAYGEYTQNEQDIIKVNFVLNFYNKVEVLKQKTTLLAK